MPATVDQYTDSTYVPEDSDQERLLPETFLVRLKDSIDWSRRQLMPGIQKRLDIIRQIVGRHYSTGAARERVLFPYLRMQTSILSRHLVSRSPRLLIETKDPKLRAQAKYLSEWFAQRSDCMDLEHILHRWAYEALIYPVGFIKVCGGDPGHNGYFYLDNIDPERMVWDMAAKSWSQIDFVGHRYTISKDDLLKEENGYDQARVKPLRPDPYLQMNELGYEKTETLGQDTPFNFWRLRDYIDVWELYLPKEGVLIHLPVTGGIINYRPIKQEPYVGMLGRTNCGPFHRLTFEEVPGNLLGSPPVHAIFDMHEAINKIGRKSVRQAERQKTNMLVQQTMTSDADKVRKGGDGDYIPVSNPEMFKETRMGGPDQQNFAYLLNLSQQISKFGGNFDVLGGLDTDARTLGQERMLNANSNTLVQYLRDEVTSASAEVCRSLMWYEWNSIRTQQVSMPVPGMPQERYVGQVTPEQRQIEDFYRLQFSVHPYSMGSVNPGQRMQQWLQIYQGVLQPSLPFLAQQGGMLDIVAFAKKLAEYMDLPDLDEVLKINPVDPMQQPQPMGAPRTRPPGTGEYTRTDVGQNNQQAQNDELLSMMKQGESGQ